MKIEHSEHADVEYCDLLSHILKNGVEKGDRTGTGTKSIFGTQMRFDLTKGFPLLTTKEVSFEAILHELLWFVSGNTNIRSLVLNKVNIWNEWPCKAYLIAQGKPVPPSGSPEWKAELKAFVEKIKTDEAFAATWGELGPVYGYQWRKWRCPDGRVIDQIQDTVDLIKKSPNSRRIIVSAWNPADIAEMDKSGLPPCHCLFQFWSHNGKLSCQLYQRSCDTFLGVPYNIASYSLLLMMMAQVCGMEAHEFIWTGGDTHIYNNHMEQVKEQLSRTPRSMPKVTLNPEIKNIFDFKASDFILTGYDPHGPIRAPIAV